MFMFRSPALTTGGCQCGHPDGGLSDLPRRISSHRTSQGHVVYYRCDCGVTHMALLRWSTEPSSGTTRLR